MRDAEQVSYLYHMATDWLAKVSLMDNADAAELRERLKVSASSHRDEDSVALRILANAIEPYLQGE